MIFRNPWIFRVCLKYLFVFFSLVISLYGDINGIINEQRTTLASKFVFEVLGSPTNLNSLISSKTSNNHYPVELWSLRTDFVKNHLNLNEFEDENNELTNPIFDIYDLAHAIKEISKEKDFILKLIQNSDQKELFNKRLEQLEDIADRALIMQEDKWRATYVDSLMQHIIGLRAAGIRNVLPKLLWQKPGDVLAFDEYGQPFGGLRQEYSAFWPKEHYEKEWKIGQDKLSALWLVYDYMYKQGANLKVIPAWLNTRCNSSSVGFGNMERYFVRQRSLPLNAYYFEYSSQFTETDLYQNDENIKWVDGKAFECYPGSGCFNYNELLLTPEEIFKTHEKAIIIWHAFVQEILSYTQFRFNNQKKRTVRLMRTMNKEVLEKYGIHEHGQYIIKHGILSSTTLFRPFSHWDSLITLEVPHHRIFALYFTERFPGYTTFQDIKGDGPIAFNPDFTGAICSDLENEVIALLEGLPINYISNNDVDLLEDPSFDDLALNLIYQNYKSDNIINPSFKTNQGLFHKFLELSEYDEKYLYFLKSLNIDSETMKNIKINYYSEAFNSFYYLYRNGKKTDLSFLIKYGINKELLDLELLSRNFPHGVNFLTGEIEEINKLINEFDF